MTNRDLSRRQAHWALYLSRFDFKIEYSAGKTIKADRLSRRVDLQPEEKDNQNQTLLPAHFLALIDVQTYGTIDDYCRRKLEDAASGWTRANGLAYTEKDQLYVPNDANTHKGLIREAHDPGHVGHPGVKKSYELLSRDYYWPGMTTDVEEYIKTCPTCQQVKIYPAKKAGLLQPISPAHKPWEEIGVDLITGLPESQGYNAILTICDRYTKRPHFIPCTDSLSSMGLARLFRDNVWKYHGWPAKVISDRGPQFASKLMADLNQLLNVETALSTAYHPQTDGQTERLNQDVEIFLRLYVNHMQDDWAEWLSQAEFSYSNRIHSATGYTPFYLDHGRHPRTPLNVIPRTTSPSADEFVTQLQEARAKADAALTQAAKDMKRFADRSWKEVPVYKVGDQVYLDTENLHLDWPSPKLSQRRLGPFTVTRVLSPTAVTLRLPRSWRVHPTVHVSRIWLAHVDNIAHLSNDFLAPPPIVIDGTDEYEVEEILREKKVGRGMQYLVKWKGYPRSEATWEPRNQLMKHALDIVKDWEEHRTTELFRFEVEALLEEGVMSGDEIDELISAMSTDAE
jgi:hypothetical protein